MAATVRVSIEGPSPEPGEHLPDGTPALLSHLPAVLARVHRATAPGTEVVFDVRGHVDDPDRRLGPYPGLQHLLMGAGFEPDRSADDGPVRAVRSRSLADTVGPDMRVLVCGLNPSEYAADRGVGYARPGNRFWPAALSAGLVTRSHDPRHALESHGVGMTDLVKRATTAANALTVEEYRRGAKRVEALAGWLRPGVVCFVGLEGWRAAVDRTVRPGLQSRRFGGRRAYVMPSTSGRNAHASLSELTGHLRAVADLGRDGAGLQVGVPHVE
ncbi:MAG TPA: mismatch-specific DNA-glycosylase [Acidimicrobiales bacterium]|nr:mismatch-specific DNA-glycosylase [Acidimicrobiales bacterium]